MTFNVENIIALFIGALLGGFIMFFIFLLFLTDEKHPDLETKAKVLLSIGSMNEIRNFIYSKMNYLKEETIKKLCARYQELEIDQVIQNDEDRLKTRIDLLTNEDGVIEDIEYIDGYPVKKDSDNLSGLK